MNYYNDIIIIMEKLPKKGDEIYIPSAYYCYRGIDDFEGGLSIISEVIVNNDLPLAHINAIKCC